MQFAFWRAVAFVSSPIHLLKYGLLVLWVTKGVWNEQIVDTVTPYVIASASVFQGLTTNEMIVKLTPYLLGTVNIYGMTVDLCCWQPVSTGAVSTFCGFSDAFPFSI